MNKIFSRFGDFFSGNNGNNSNNNDDNDDDDDKVSLLKAITGEFLGKIIKDFQQNKEFSPKMTILNTPLGEVFDKDKAFSCVPVAQAEVNLECFENKENNMDMYIEYVSAVRDKMIKDNLEVLITLTEMHPYIDGGKITKENYQNYIILSSTDEKKNIFLVLQITDNGDSIEILDENDEIVKYLKEKHIDLYMLVKGATDLARRKLGTSEILQNLIPENIKNPTMKWTDLQ